MDAGQARLLASERGRRLLEAARETRTLAAHARPRRLLRLGRPEEVRLALRQDDLRRRAGARIPEAERLLFTAQGLEQATAWTVASERAGRWPRPRDVPLLDLGAGLGVDALATAAGGRPVVAYERDPARAILLRHNARALGVAERVCVREEDVLAARPRGPLGFLDPDRRPGGRRTRDPLRFEPPATAWEGLLSGIEAGMVKLPPAGATPAAPEGPRETVSLDGRVRERRLFVGAFGDLPPRRALSLPSGRSVQGEGLPWPDPRAPWEGAWLLDPDPAVTLAGLVGDLARAHGLAPIHPRIAYLLGGRRATQAPGTWIRVEARLPARGREVGRWLRDRGVGRLTIRTRGVADGPEVWRRRLRPRGPRAATAVFTRDPDDRWVALLGPESR